MFRLTGINNCEREIAIHIIDINKGIAVFEQIAKGKEKTYYLMIAADNIKSVPVIVNHCPIQKQAELTFDKPDFEALLKRK